MPSGAISIHAPLRGRPGYNNFSWFPPHFNPRPLAGATGSPDVLSGGQEFQSTPPCGGDWASRSRQGDDPDFNPRPLAGATPERL